MLYGLDIGGSTLKAVKLSADGTILGTRIEPAGGRLPRDALLQQIRSAVEALVEGEPPRRIGLAFGGAIQPDGTMLSTITNLPNLAGLPLVETFSTLLGAPCRVENDARAAMRGEAWTGAAKGLNHAMVLTLGSGIGAGLLSGSRIIEGAHGKAGEIGLWHLHPRPGQEPWLTFEDLAAPVRLGTREGLDFGALFAAWATGDGSVMDAAVEAIGRAIANAHLMLDLEAVILLGGVTAIGEPFRLAVERAFEKACPEEFQVGLAFRVGELGQFAGAVGAASLWRGETG